MHLELNAGEIESLVRNVVTEVLATIDWPQGRLALTEEEAAASLGVNRHVLRDLRLAGKLTARRLGRKIVYTRNDLLAVIGESQQ